jgi:hypothetical protein
MLNVCRRRHIDTPAKTLTLKPMPVLLQIRVESQVAENLKQAAKLRGQTPDAYLRQVVKNAASVESRPVKTRRKPAALESNRLSYDLVARMRADYDDE